MSKKGNSKVDWNTDEQYYKGIRLRLIVRYDYHVKQAVRFTLNDTNQNVWIPKKHLDENGIIKPNEDLDYIFRSSPRQLTLAGYTEAIQGIKRRD